MEFALDWSAEAVRSLPEDRRLRKLRAEAPLLTQQTDAALPLWQDLEADFDAPRNRAAVLLCELSPHAGTVSAIPKSEVRSISQAALGWYRRWIKFGAVDAVKRVTDRSNLIRMIPPQVSAVLVSGAAATR